MSFLDDKLSTDIELEEAIEIGGSGTSNYENLINKPSINGVTLSGNIEFTINDFENDANYINRTALEDAIENKANYEYVDSELEKMVLKADFLKHEQEEEEKIDTLEKSVLKKADISIVPTNTSDLTNNSDFITKSYVDTALREKVSNSTFETYKTSANASIDLKANKSDLSKKADISTVPTKISQLANDAGFSTKAYVDTVASEKTSSSEFKTYKTEVETSLSSKATKDELRLKADAASIPTKTSQITNDSSFVTESEVDTKIQEAITNILTAGY